MIVKCRLIILPAEGLRDSIWRLVSDSSRNTASEG